MKLASIESIPYDDVAGTATIGGGLFNKSTELPFKVQVSATEGTIVGYDWLKNNKQDTQE